MKKTVVAAILGLSTLGAAFGQGHILFSNYLTSPYNQVRWDAGVPTVGNGLVNNPAVQLQIYYGLGVVANSDALLPGVVFTVEPTYSGIPGNGGNGGWFIDVTQTFSAQEWAPGATLTFQIRAFGDASAMPGGQPGDVFAGSTGLWQESARITSTSGAPLSSAIMPPLVVDVIPIPEPSSLALLGLGALGTILFRRRMA